MSEVTNNKDALYPHRWEFFKHIKIVETKTLGIHEEINPRRTNELMDRMQSSGYFTCPIPACHYKGYFKNKNLGRGKSVKDLTVVTDGMHRAAAAKELRLKYTPVIDIPYLYNNSTMLYSWVRTLKKVEERRFFPAINNFNDELKSKKLPTLRQLDEEEKKQMKMEIRNGNYPKDLTLIYNNVIYTPIKPLDDTFDDKLNQYRNYCLLLEKILGLPVRYSGYFEAERRIKKRESNPKILENKLKKLEKPYIDFDIAKRKYYHKKRVTLFPPLLKKFDVIKVAEKNLIHMAKNVNLFPVHTTRHVLPFRLFGTLISLKTLDSKGKSADQLTKEIRSQLMKIPKKEVGIFLNGTTFDKRKYEVPTIILNKSKMADS